MQQMDGHCWCRSALPHRCGRTPQASPSRKPVTARRPGRAQRPADTRTIETERPTPLRPRSAGASPWALPTLEPTTDVPCHTAVATEEGAGPDATDLSRPRSAGAWNCLCRAPLRQAGHQGKAAAPGPTLSGMARPRGSGPPLTRPLPAELCWCARARLPPRFPLERPTSACPASRVPSPGAKGSDTFGMRARGAAAGHRRPAELTRARGWR
jgi:hypothetical protein